MNDTLGLLISLTCIIKLYFSAEFLGIEAEEEHERNWFHFIKLLMDNFTWVLQALFHLLNILFLYV